MKLPNEPTDSDVKEATEEFLTRLKYEWYRSGKDYRWHLVAGNGEILCHGQAYSRKKDMMSAIALVKGSADAEVVKRDAGWSDAFRIEVSSTLMAVE